MTRQGWRDLVREAKNLNFPDTTTCSLPHQKFKQEFIKQSKVGIIKKCSAAWPAQEKWSIKGLLGRHNGKKLWKVNFVNRCKHLLQPAAILSLFFFFFILNDINFCAALVLLVTRRSKASFDLEEKS